MPFLPFQVSSANDFIAQPVASTKIVAVSSSAADAAKVLTIKGRDGGTPQSGTLTLNGLKEAVGTDDWTELSTISAGASLTGSVGIFGEGTAAIGDIRVDGRPTSGTTLQLGLSGSGNFQTYTFRNPATYRLTWTAFGAISGLNDLYFDLRLGATTYRFWFDYESTGTAPASGGNTLVEVDITSSMALPAVLEKLIDELESVTSFAWIGRLTGTQIYVESEFLGAQTMAGSRGTLTSWLDSLTNLTAGTADAANQIRTSLNPNITASEIATYLEAAFTADVTSEGRWFGTGTTANAYVTPTVVGAVITITDKIACLRQLPWHVVASSSSANLTIRLPVGGVAGTLLAYLTGTQQVSRPMNFNDPGLAETPLIALTTPTSDPVYQGGRPASLRIRTTDESTALTVDLEFSDNGTIWHKWATFENQDVDGDNIIQELPPFEFVRLVVDANTRTVDRALHAGIVVF